jgi:hypothetical protein
MASYNEIIIVVLLVQLYRTFSFATLIPFSSMLEAYAWNSKVLGGLHQKCSATK